MDYGGAGGRSGGPVQFEKDEGEADPFGLDQVRQYAQNLRSKTRNLALKPVEFSRRIVYVVSPTV